MEYTVANIKLITTDTIKGDIIFSNDLPRLDGKCPVCLRKFKFYYGSGVQSVVCKCGHFMDLTHEYIVSPY
jgi:hypothetical protein